MNSAIRNLTMSLSLVVICGLESVAAQPACKPQQRQETVSLNLAFNQGRVNRGFVDLNNVAEDARTQKQLSQIWSARSFEMNEQTPFQTMMEKKELLAILTKNIGSAKYVNFNYSGHGILLADGEWAIPLPAMPPSLLAKCRGDIRLENDKANARKAKSWSPGCEGLEKYVVRSSDLRKAFAGKKVFGLNDSCFSGGLDLGPNSSMLNSAGRDQISDDSANITRLSGEVAKRECVPLGSNQPKTFDDLQGLFLTANGGKQLPVDKIEQLICASPVSRTCKSQFITTTDQLANVTGNREQNSSWTSCYPLSKAMPPACQSGTTSSPQQSSESFR